MILDGIKAVLFDLDGTVIDSMWIWEAIDREYLGKYNIKFDKQYQRDIEGMSFNETAVYFKEVLKVPEEIEEMKKRWNLMAWDKYCNEVLPKKGVIAFLEFLKKKGIKTGIGTSNSIELCNAILDSKKLRRYFDVVHTANEVQAGKPSPDIYLLVAHSLGVRPEECIVFEDLYQGIIAGKNAGMKTCAVADEYSAYTWEDKLIAADYAINTFEDKIITDNWRNL